MNGPTFCTVWRVARCHDALNTATPILQRCTCEPSALNDQFVCVIRVPLLNADPDMCLPFKAGWAVSKLVDICLTKCLKFLGAELIEDERKTR